MLRPRRWFLICGGFGRPVGIRIKGGAAAGRATSVKTIDRYILRQTLSRFTVLLGLVLFILLMERLVRLLDLLATKNTPVDVILRMMVSLVPHYLSIALSAAFFIAVLMAMIRLREDSELDAFYAGGVSLYRVAAPIAALSLVFVLVAALIIGVLQ